MNPAKNIMLYQRSVTGPKDKISGLGFHWIYVSTLSKETK